MACLVQRNNEGRIVKVTTPEGKKSKLFEAVHSIPFLAGAETSFEIVKNAYSNKVEKLFEGRKESTYNTGEPKLFLRTNGREFESIEEAIIYDSFGEVLLGFKHPDTNEFMAIASFDMNATKDSQFIRSAISQGLMSPERVLMPDGTTRFQGKGNFLNTRLAGAHGTRFEAMVELGRQVKMYPDGTFEIKSNEFIPTAINQDGTSTVLRPEDILDYVKENNPQNAASLLYDYYTTVEMPRPLRSEDQPSNKVSIDKLRKSMFSFLESMGFSVTTLEAYQEAYKNRHGEDPDVAALADMANKVVAFREGRIDIDQLTEEVAHVAIEAYADQNSIGEALANVHLTPEYAEYAEYYRNKYAAQKQGVELEEMVRKEILGKVLAKEFQNRLEGTNRSENQSNLLDRLREIWQNFLQIINDNINLNHVNRLQELNQKIADSVIGQRLDEFDANNITAGTFYSATSSKSKTIEARLAIGRRQLEELFHGVLKSPIPDISGKLDTIAEDMTTLNALSALNSIVGITDSQAKALLANAKKAERTGEVLSEEDLHREVFINSSLDTARQALNDMKSVKNLSIKEKKILSEIETIVKDIDNSKNIYTPILSENRESYSEEVINKIMAQYNLTEAEKERLWRDIEAEKKDITTLGYYFGLISKSKNPLLSLLSKYVKDMRYVVEIAYINKVNPLIQKFAGENFRAFQESIIQRDKDGKRTYYMEHMVNQHIVDEVEMEEKVRLVKRLKPSLEESVIRQRLKTERPQALLQDQDLIKEYKKEYEKFKQEEFEQRVNEEYTKKKQERYDNNFVSEFTQEIIANKNRVNAARNAKYRDGSGRVDSSKKTPADLKQEQDAKAAYQAILSPFENGEVKVGLRIVKAEDLTAEQRAALPFEIDANYTGDVVLPQEDFSTQEEYKQALDRLENDSRASIDLNNLNLVYRSELQDKSKTSEPIKEFFDTLERLEKESPKKAFEWMAANSTLSLSPEYYDSLDTETFTPYSQVAREYIQEEILDPIERRINENRVQEIEDLMREKRYILKKYSKVGNPLEKDSDALTTPDKERINAIDQDIKNIKNSIGVPSDRFEQFTSELSERKLSEDFEKLREDSGLSAYDFIVNNRHAPQYKLVHIMEFAQAIEAYIDYGNVKIKKSYSEFIDEMFDNGVVNDSMSNEEVISKLKDEFAKRNAASYFQRFEPKGYSEFMSKLKKGEISVSEMLNPDTREAFLERHPVARFLDVSPDFTWSQDLSGESVLNERYMDHPFYRQPKLVDKNGNPTKYVNKAFFDKYGIDMQAWLKKPTMNLNELKPTRNQSEFEFLREMVNLRKETLELQGDASNISEFQLPQVSSNDYEKIVNTIQMKTGVKAAFEDLTKSLFQDRIDDKLHGEVVEGSTLNVKTIPKYYQQRLEDPEMITMNTFHSVLMDHKEALLYSKRRESEGAMNAMLKKIENDNIVVNGRGGKATKIGAKGQSSNLYKKAQEYLDYHLYGIKQHRKMETSIMGKTVNLTKLITTFQAITRFGNLAFHPIVDATSLTTGFLVNVSDRLAQEYYHPSSANRAFQVTTEVFKYIAESGKVNKTSELNHIMELFNTESIDSRLQNSSLARGLRLAQKAPFGLAKISNMGIKPKAIMSVLVDHRLIDGQFYSWQEYFNKRRVENPKLTTKDIEIEFKKAKMESFYDYLDISKEGIKPNKKFQEQFGENYQEAYMNQLKKLSSKVESMIQTIDTVISPTDQLAAQRDVLTNQLMMHRGWLPINLTKRFKAEHFDAMTGQYEEGHYVTLAKVIKDMLVDGTGKRRLGNMKEVYNSLGTHQKKNLNRVLFESMLFAALVLLGQAIFAADDDDDDYITDMMQYIALRTINEYTSANLFGISRAVINTAKSPITAIRTIENFEPITLASNMLGAVTGDFEPLGKTIKAISPLKRIDQLSDLKEQTSAYFYFNKSTLPFEHPATVARREVREERKRRKEELEKMRRLMDIRK